jgi:hypothetical protein
MSQKNMNQRNMNQKNMFQLKKKQMKPTKEKLRPKLNQEFNQSQQKIKKFLIQINIIPIDLI